jgi:hypothetical protein
VSEHERRLTAEQYQLTISLRLDGMPYAVQIQERYYALCHMADFIHLHLFSPIGQCLIHGTGPFFGDNDTDRAETDLGTS